MPEVNFRVLNDGLIDFFTQYQAMVTEHGPKDVMQELRKGKSTIYAEMSLENMIAYLDSIENYDEKTGKPNLPKLGVVDMMITMLRTGKTEPFIRLARILSLSCADSGRKACNMEKEDFVRLLKKFNEEYVQGVNEVLQSVADGKVSLSEAKRSRNEMMDIVDAALCFVAIFDQIIKEKS